MVKRLFHLAVVFLLAGLAFGQQPDTYQDQTRVEPMDHTPVYRVKVVLRRAEAMNDQNHSGKTSLDFRGTNLMPDARGRATVESRTGRIEINTELEHLQSPRSFGPEYLTYVLWAITPEGRASNLGEVPVFDDGKSSVKVTTDLQAFGLIVTAEPYFAVTRPSNLVVLENVVRKNTKGWEEPRVLSIRKRQEERQEAERRATEQRAIEAQNQAEQAQQSAEQAKAQADDEARQRAEAERDRRAAERAKTEAEQARQQAEAARADALAQQQAAQSQALQAQQTAQQAEQARQQTEQQAQETRERLLQQLNQ